MNKRKLLRIINIVLLIAMVIHVAIAWYLHAQCPMNSAPAWLTIIYSIYYLIPLAIINTAYLIISLVRRKKNK